MRIKDLPVLPTQESDSVEFKREPTIEALARTVAAFLNGRGGIVLVGYSDNGQLVGLSSDAETVASEIRQGLARAITPKESFQVTPIRDDRRTGLLIEIPEGARKPYLVSGRVYVRRGTSDVVATPADISRIIGQRTLAEERWERRPHVGVGPAMLNLDDIEKAVAIARASGIRTVQGVSTLEDLAALDLVAEGWPTGAAVALFISERAALHRLPQARARFAAFEDETLAIMTDNADVVGGAIRILEQLFGLLRSRLHSVARLPSNNLQREETAAYPLAAVREALVNALMHREYDDIGAVRVSLFPDRLEVWNPGRLPEAYIRDPEARLASRPHNPDIARIFNMLGYAEVMGIGLWRIRQEMTDAGLPEPTWTNHADGVLLTLRNAKSAGGSVPKNPVLHARALAFLRETEPNQRFTSSEYRERFAADVSPRSARNDIRMLVEHGYLIQQGQGYQTVYVRSPKRIDEAE